MTPIVLLLFYFVTYRLKNLSRRETFRHSPCCHCLCPYSKVLSWPLSSPARKLGHNISAAISWLVTIVLEVTKYTAKRSSLPHRALDPPTYLPPIPGPPPWTIAWLCSAKRCPVLSLVFMNLSTHRLMQVSSLVETALDVKSLMQSSKHL